MSTSTQRIPQMTLRVETREIIHVGTGNNALLKTRNTSFVKMRVSREMGSRPSVKFNLQYLLMYRYVYSTLRKICESRSTLLYFSCLKKLYKGGERIFFRTISFSFSIHGRSKFSFSSLFGVHQVRCSDYETYSRS